MWKAAESRAVPGGERTREEDKQPSEGGSSVSGTFTDRLCSVQLATRIRGLKVETEVAARERDLEA